MIRKRNYLPINEKGQELPEGDMTQFNLVANDGDICRYAGNCISAHWHAELELFVLLEGCVQLHIADRDYLFHAGDGCFINADVLHSFTAYEVSSCHFHSFVFDSSIIGGCPGSIFDTAYMRPLTESGISCICFKNDGSDRRFYDNFNRAFAACADEAYGYELTVREALGQLLLFILTEKGGVLQPRRPALQEQRLKQMLSWIDEHLSQPVTTQDIADSAAICVRECQRLFKRYLHEHPMAWVRKRRILLAAQRLAGSDTPVTTIALELGFASPSHFTLHFKEMTGMTPSAYRHLQKDQQTLPGTVTPPTI